MRSSFGDGVAKRCAYLADETSRLRNGCAPMARRCETMQGKLKETIQVAETWFIFRLLVRNGCADMGFAIGLHNR